MQGFSRVHTEQGSGNDETMFYQLAEHRSALARNASGLQVRGEDVVEWGGVPAEVYRGCLRVIAMGVENAAGAAQKVVCWSGVVCCRVNTIPLMSLLIHW